MNTFVNNIPKIEPRLRLAIGILLWLISAILTTSLFISLAKPSIYRQIVMVVLAVALEAGKPLTFRMGKGYRLLALALILVSITASFGSALLLIEENRASSNRTVMVEAQNTYAYKAAKAEIESLDAQITVAIERLKVLPENYVTASKDVTTSIERMRDRRVQLLESLEIDGNKMSVSTSPVTMFTLFAKITNLKESTVVLGLLMSLSILLEIMILALTKNYAIQRSESQGMFQGGNLGTNAVEGSINTSTKSSTESFSENAYKHAMGDEEVEDSTSCLADLPPAFHASSIEGITADQFLEELARDLPFPQLHGRNATAARIGLPFYRAQVFVKKLLKEEKIRVEGKRLVRTGMFQNTSSQELGANDGKAS